MRILSRALAGLTVLVLLSPTPLVGAETHEIDSVHSDVTFRIRHLVSRVTGNFRDFSGTIEIDQKDLTKSSVRFEIDTGSIDTRNERRDGHLRSADFFDAENHPKIRFVSSKISRDSGDVYRVTGLFTMHGVTKEITIPVEVLGFTSHPRFGDRAGFTTTFTLNRSDYGIEWNAPMNADRFILGDEVSVEINLETVKKVPEEAGSEEAESKAASN